MSVNEENLMKYLSIFQKRDTCAKIKITWPKFYLGHRN
jgi:hypothetical protein